MKVVLFCGGPGMRLQESSERLPKPMVTIGYRPLLWHIMKYYAHYGHTDFLLCLGYGADVIKDYFINYSECLSNDFVLSNGGKQLQLISSDIQDWTITFVDTGITTNVGQRLKAVENYLEGEDVFLANYTDGLTDMPLPAQLRHFDGQSKIGSFLCVKPNLSYHFVSTDADGLVTDITRVRGVDLQINGGYFIFHRDIFKYLHAGEELLYKPFQRLVEQQQLLAYKHQGFWACLDTFKDKQLLDDLYAKGQAPWEVWKRGGPQA
jgi:glucose-1-phosphate cytidylyltransferase